MPAQQTAECATPISEKAPASSSTLPSSKPSAQVGQSDYNSHSSDIPARTSATLSSQRISMYLNNPVHSHLLHRHASCHESVQGHTHAINQFLTTFDATMGSNGF
ncbi:hypothetical protein EG329_013698 [Mollisiaceae sp. DMI_Dod_QoI]|nr:hypothetical protein EG329_013698 [Helotiales sp. DMI_Dod_QoI]